MKVEIKTPVPLTDGVEMVTLVCKKCDFFSTDVCKADQD